MTAGSITIAAAQLAAVNSDVDANLAAMKKAIEHASRLNVSVIVFPELFVTGYHAGTDFSALADVKDGAIFRFVSEQAAAAGVAVCYGYAERDGDDIFNAAQFIDANGRSLTNHRKTHLYGDYEKQWFTPGNECVSSTHYLGVTFSTLICYEIEFPELARANARQGANVLLVPTAVTATNNPEHIVQLLVRARAAENHLYVVYVNHAYSESEGDFNGASLIAGLLGKVLAQSDTMQQELLCAELSLDVIPLTKRTLPYLDDLREDIFYDDRPIERRAV